jgi:putative tricarboxylic transport membrane protein
MLRFGFPVVPMLLAIVLGPAFEQHVRLALITSNGDPSIFVTKPISLVFVLVAAFVFLSPIIRGIIEKRKETT